MPAVATGIGAAWGGISALWGTVIVGSVTVGSLATTVALTGGSYLIQKAMAKKARQSGMNSEMDKQTVQQALPNARLVYGRALVSGPLFFFERRGNWLYQGIVLANHEIAAVDEIRMGDKTVTFDGSGAATSTPFFDGATRYLYASVRLGTDDQAIDPILAADFPELPATFRQRGRATAVLKMYQPLSIGTELNRSLYGNSGQPAPLFLVSGAKVFDPRDPGQSASNKSTWKWSENPSLILADYLTRPSVDGCGGFSWSQISMSTIMEAAHRDDDLIPLKAGGTEKRYTLNGTVTLDGTAWSEVASRLLTSNMGQLVTSGGEFKIYSGVARAPCWTLNDNSARGTINARLRQAQNELVNIVTTSFVSSERGDQVQEGPILRREDFIAADGAELPLSIELPFTRTHTTAQRIARATMLQARAARSMSRTEDHAALLLDAADVVNVESSFVGLAEGTYSISSIMTSDNPLEFSVELSGYDPQQFDWSPATDEQDFTINPVSTEE